ncbi:MAG: hypothetical protein AB1473_21395 [Thermodesulfobacteriota bacterium]
MRCMYRLVIAMMAAGLLFPPIPGVADFGPMDMLIGGGAAAPKSSHVSIRLESQEVTIHLRKDTYTVDAIFQFFNTEETTTEWIGFPKQTATRGVPRSRANFIRFNTWVNGREVGFSEEPDFKSHSGVEQRKWLVHQITFPGHTRTIIRVSYKASYNFFGPRPNAYYIYGTGSYWKDNIGKAVFIIDSSYVGGTKYTDTHFPSKLGGRRISENLVMYEIGDFKPDPEAVLRVLVLPRPPSRK